MDCLFCLHTNITVDDTAEIGACPFINNTILFITDGIDIDTDTPVYCPLFADEASLAFIDDVGGA